MIGVFDAGQADGEEDVDDDEAQEEDQNELTLHDITEIYVSNDMRNLPSEVFADNFEKREYEEECYRRMRQQLVQAGIQAVTSSPGPHPQHVWEAAAAWDLEAVQRPNSSAIDEDDWCVVYLKRFGFSPVDGSSWQTTPEAERDDPELSFCIPDLAHEEHAGHTWYMVECSLAKRSRPSLPNASMNAFVKCRSPRRLTHLRDILQEPLMGLLEDEYASVFANAPFPLRMAPPGTTARLRAWLNALATAINGGSISPHVAAWVLVFFLPFKLRLAGCSNERDETNEYDEALEVVESSTDEEEATAPVDSLFSPTVP